MNVFVRCYRGLKGFFGRFAGFVAVHPLLFCAYLLVFLIGVVFYVFLELNYGTLQFDEGSRSAGGVFICRFLGGGLSNPGGYLTSYRLSVLGFSQDKPNVLFIMDTSGSMTWNDGQSQSRLERMKEALSTIINGATNINLGLMR